MIFDNVYNCVDALYSTVLYCVLHVHTHTHHMFDKDLMFLQAAKICFYRKAHAVKPHHPA